MVAVFGIGERAAVTGARLVEALEHACERSDEEEEEPLPPFAEPPPWGPTELSPREAFLAGQEVVGFAAAAGPNRGESLAAYPPGVPNVLPGEPPDRADAHLHHRQRRPRRPRARRERPDAENRPSGRAMTTPIWRRARPDAEAEQKARGVAAGQVFEREREDVARGIPRSWGADSETGVLRDVLLGPPEQLRVAADEHDLQGHPGERRRSSTASSPSRSTARWSRLRGQRGQRPLPRAGPPPPLPGVRARLERQRPAGPDRHPAAPSPGAAANTRR